MQIMAVNQHLCANFTAAFLLAIVCGIYAALDFYTLRCAGFTLQFALPEEQRNTSPCLIDMPSAGAECLSVIFKDLYLLSRKLSSCEHIFNRQRPIAVQLAWRSLSFLRESVSSARALSRPVLSLPRWRTMLPNPPNERGLALALASPTWQTVQNDLNLFN